MSTFHRLHRKGQFMLGPRPFSRVPGWNTLQIDTDLLLAVHPSVPVARAQEGNMSLTVLGHLLDPRAPDDTNGDILTRLCARALESGRLDNLPRLTDGFFGRWVILAASGPDALLVPDAAGQRQVHHVHHEGKMYCASQAGAIAERLGFTPNPEAVRWRERMRDRLGEAFHHQFWWPGSRSLFAGVNRLLPNNVLDLRTGEVRRFFGRGTLERRSLDEAVRRGAELMQGGLQSARRRRHLAFSCSAGWDSRAMMAASLPLRDDVLYFSRRFYYRSRRHRDIAVPGRLLSRAGITHRILNMPPAMTSEFASIYRANVDAPHEDWALMAEGLARTLPADTLIVVGNVSATCKHRYRHGGPVTHVTPEVLAQRTGMQPDPFALEAFGEWLDAARFGESFHPFDMCYWEQRSGSWAAEMNAEVAIAQEQISAYNCRELLATLLSVDESHRHGPDHKLYQRLITHMWPDGLSEPVNPPIEPPSFLERGLDTAKSLVRRLLPGPAVRLAKRLIRRSRGV